MSYRIPDYPSPSYAICSPLPGPSAIKLAIVATAIETTNNVESGERVFNIIKNAKIKIKTPKGIALSNLLIKRLKQSDPTKVKTELEGICDQCGRHEKLWQIDEKRHCKQCATKLDSTFGIRGYAHLSEPLTIYLEIPPEKEQQNAQYIEDIVRKVRHIGTSDSIVYCTNVSEEEPPSSCIEPQETLDKAQRNVLLVPVKDINPDPKVKFTNVNPYTDSTRKDVFVKRFYLLPIARQTQGKNWLRYELK